MLNNDKILDERQINILKTMIDLHIYLHDSHTLFFSFSLTERVKVKYIQIILSQAHDDKL